MPLIRVSCAALCLFLGLGACGGGGRAPVTPPLIAVSLTFEPPLPPLLKTGDVYDGIVRLSNPDLHALTVTLLNPPPGCFFEAGRAVPHGDERRMRWVVPAEALGTHRLEFFAAGHVEAGASPSDDLHRERRVGLDTRVEVGTVAPGGTFAARSMQVADVTGDGRPDLVALVPLADVNTTSDAGVVLVWRGAASPSGTPLAELRAPSPQAGDQLGGGAGALLQLADVTGDGVLDVLVGAPSRDLGGVADAGSVLVWRGGATLVGTPSPLAEVRRATPHAGDGADLRFKVMDCTGDGIRDVVLHLPLADTTAPDVGAVLVAAGGANLGVAAATELGHAFSSQANLRLGQASDGDGLHAADVTGDGKAELMLAAPPATLFGSLLDAGCVLIWQHVGATNAATFVGRRLIPQQSAGGGLLGRGVGVHTADVTGDGIADVVTASRLLGGLGAEMGQGSVWFGGSTILSQNEIVSGATLFVASPSIDAHLGEGPGGLQLGDVTGDGVADILAAAPLENGSQGAIYMWQGGAGLTEGIFPTVRLADPNGLPGDGLAGTLGRPSHAFHLADLTGDGTLDVLAAAPHVGLSRFVDVGVIHLFAGGAVLSPVPSATLALASPSSGAQLGRSKFLSGAAGIHLVDLSGDGVLDVLALAGGASSGGVGGAGVLALWRGGAGFTGLRAEDALFADPSPLTDGGLGAGGGDHPWIADLTGDRVPELIASSSTPVQGRLVVWSPGASPSGTLEPVASRDTDPFARLRHMMVGDLDADGLADVAFAEHFTLTTPASSAVRVLPGAAALAALVSLDAPAAIVGMTSSVAIVVGDVTGDNQPDVVVGAPGDEVAGTAGAGTLRLHDLSPGGFGNRIEHMLGRQTPRALDNLGN